MIEKNQGGNEPVNGKLNPLANDLWPTLTVAEVESMRNDANSAQGYRNAFYEVAQMLGLSALPMCPREAWEIKMKPALQAALPGFQYVAGAVEGNVTAPALSPREQPEPVAWRYNWSPHQFEQWSGWEVSTRDPRIHGTRRYRNVQPLYAHPSKQPELDATISPLAGEQTGGGGFDRDVAARAVYAARPARYLHPEERNITWDEAQTECPDRISQIYRDVDAILAALSTNGVA